MNDKPNIAAGCESEFDEDGNPIVPSVPEPELETVPETETENEG